MSAKPTVIEHLGRVDAVTQNSVRVVITSQSACASCHAKNACPASEVSEKQVVVTKPNHGFLVGDTVKVLLRQSLGYRALLLGYLLPLAILLVALFTFRAFTSEGKAGLQALLCLFPYYATLYLFRDRIARKFSFDIEKIS